MNFNGYIIGGGIELVLCCDICIVCFGVKFFNLEVMFGMVFGWMGIECVFN